MRDVHTYIVCDVDRVMTMARLLSGELTDLIRYVVSGSGGINKIRGREYVLVFPFGLDA
jgi:hypothetical protein